MDVTSSETLVVADEEGMIERRIIIIIQLDGLPGFARIPKRKINQEFKKYMTRLRFEPGTSYVAIGYSKYLAIDQKEKLIKY